MAQNAALRVTPKWCEGIVHRIQGSAAPVGDVDDADAAPVGDAKGAMSTLIEIGDLHRARAGPGKSFHLSELLQVMPLKSAEGFWEGVEAVAFPALDEMAFLPDDEVDETLDEEEEEEGGRGEEEKEVEAEAAGIDQDDDFLAINESAMLGTGRKKQRNKRTARNIARFAHVRPLKAVTAAAMLVCAELELVASDRSKERARGRARRKRAAGGGGGGGGGGAKGGAGEKSGAGSAVSTVSRASQLPPAFFDLCVSLHDVLMPTAQARSQAAAAAAEEEEGEEEEEDDDENVVGQGGQGGGKQDLALLSRLYSSTLRLCERLWTLDLDRREECVPQLLPLLLLDASRNGDDEAADEEEVEGIRAAVERALKRCYAVGLAFLV